MTTRNVLFNHAIILTDLLVSGSSYTFSSYTRAQPTSKTLVILYAVTYLLPPSALCNLLEFSISCLPYVFHIRHRSCNPLRFCTMVIVKYVLTC